MPSRKQRRRRAKLQRHEYEYVLETEEGEVPVESPRAARDDEQRREAREPKPLDRRGRPVSPPSLRRVLRRSAIFAPILALFVYLTAGGELTTAGIVVNVALLLAFFIPFSYMVDVVVYRLMLRRAQRR